MKFDCFNLENNLSKYFGGLAAVSDCSIKVKKGTIILLHGRLPHYSSENRSLDSRHAYTLHIIEGNAKYPRSNWLQRTKMPLKGFINE